MDAASKRVEIIPAKRRVLILEHLRANGAASIQELGQRLFQMMLDAASGQKTKSEQHGYGQNEFVPWQISVYT